MSRVLENYGEESGMICATCANAMWRTTAEAPKDDFPDVITSSSDRSRKFAPWCMLSHAYVATEIDDCDGFVPDAEPVLDAEPEP